ncbi:MAG: phage tail sheath subtilisin-like domain-containing protein [Bryobacteraceae bacterium]
MPEYLAPGVFIEEVSFRAKTIEGVSTSTAGFIGPARYGPVDGVPEILTSFSDFERIYGGLEKLQFDGESTDMDNYLAHAVRAFFENGGRRLYVSRVYSKGNGADYAQYDLPALGSPPSLPSLPTSGSMSLRARYPGTGGNLKYLLSLRIGPNALVNVSTDPARTVLGLRGVSPGDVVWIQSSGSLPATSENLFWVERQFDAANRPVWIFHGNGSATVRLSDLQPGDRVSVLTCDAQVTYPGREQRADVWTGLGFHPTSVNSLARTFDANLSSRQKALTVPLVVTTTPANLAGPAIVTLLFGTITPATDDGRTVAFSLSNATDGRFPGQGAYEGDDARPKQKSGLKAFEDIADISIVAAPGSSKKRASANWRSEALSTAGLLISHCERMRYRIGVVDPPDELSISEVKEYRAQFDSTYAALYYPWIRILDPLTEQEINLPPSGYVAGIYARNDIEKGVHKAPANEVVRGAIGFEFMINRSQQEVLNPLGVNCFRFLDERGNRLWGARLMTSDGEWRYVNLRRFFAYLERSIERGTQWAVFESNGDALWANVRRTVEDFLFNEWKSGRLFGEKSEDAFFVRCDRSTMTQNDIDSGRLICLVGVSPLRPAEFVIFRIGQWVAPRKG